MLQYKAVIKTTLELLKRLSGYKSMDNFYLVGGTALALYFGHRISVDLDFFSSKEFETAPILDEIKVNDRIQIIQQKAKNSMNLNIECPPDSKEFIKVDFVRYDYPLINTIKNLEGIKLLSIEDIIPMKLSAIANRGAKKDFFDVYQLLEKYKLKEMFRYFSIKFPEIEHFQILKSLTYFDDAENDFDPITLKNITWEQVKARIEKAVTDYL